MKRLWLLFAQTATVLLAVYFVIATLKPQWLDRRAQVAGIVPVFEAATGGASSGKASGFRAAYQAAAHAG